MTFASQGAGEEDARSGAERRGDGQSSSRSGGSGRACLRGEARRGAEGTMRLSGQRCPVPAAGKGPQLLRKRGRKFCRASLTAGPEPGPGAPFPRRPHKGRSRPRCRSYPGPAAPAPLPAPAPAARALCPPRGCGGLRPHPAPRAGMPACKPPINSPD